MPIVTQEVLIDFITDVSQLDSAMETLTKTGSVDAQLAASFKKTTTEITAQANALKSASTNAAPLKNGLDNVARSAKSVAANFMQGFQQGVIETLQEAGVSAEEFAEALQKGGVSGAKSTQTVKQELRGLIEQLAQAKAAGKDQGEEYDNLRARAGALKDAIGDVNNEIRTTGSDTKVFDGLISGVQGVTGVFAVAQGATALFGNENKELQETLLKVNAAMAVLQGLQSVQNVLQKDSAASLLIINVQQRIRNASLVVENALQSESVIVRTAATVAQKALNVAMSANPIGLFAVALATVILTIKSFTSATEDATQKLQKLNAEFDHDIANLNKYAADVKRNGQELIASLEARGAKESEIRDQQIQNNKDEIQAILDLQRQRKADYDKSIAYLTDVANKRIKFNKEEVEENEKTKDSFEGLAKRREDLASEIRVQIIANEAKIREESLKNYEGGIAAQLAKSKEGSARQLELRKQQIAAEAALALNAQGLTENERLSIIAQGQQKQLEAQADFDKRKIDVQVKGIENQLINVEEGSREELRLRQRLISEQAASELTSTKLSESEKLKIKEKALQDQIKLQKDYTLKLTQQAIADDISRNNAELSKLKTNNDDRLLLQIANIELAASSEAAAADKNSAKIKEINAKRDADILNLRKQFIVDATNYEIELEAAKDGAHRRSLERTTSNDKKSFADRISATKQLTNIQISENDRQLDALDKQYQQRLISDQDYNLQYEKLLDKRKEAEEKNAEDIKKLRVEQFVQTTQTLLDIGRTIADIFTMLNDISVQNDQNRISSMQEVLDAAKQAGAISEKDAIARQKRIDAEEKKARTEAAEREKKVAVFNAELAIPEAFLKGLATGGPILGAVYAGLATIQAFLVRSKPIPKFGMGKSKSNRYQGIAEVGETGPELIERDGRMYVANKPTITYLGAKDVVYNPKDTQAMLSRALPDVDKNLMQQGRVDPSLTNEMKATKLAVKELNKTLAKLPVNHISIDEDGFRISVQQGLSASNYFEKRYSTR